ncbi:MAG: 3 terminal ribose 2-O-methyltransferase Hen1 [Planctomycetaceae bacterium]|nr:3 terminal ribose 2-O-methyltransferase Hen1 [Planctomycetaceae bacterium]
MLLTISTTHQPTSDLGYLLHKNPAKMQSFDLAFGSARVFYPELSDERCTVALLLEVDPIGLVRNSRGRDGESFSLAQYVNDRPYVASSFMSVAIAQVFGSALAGRSKDRPELCDQPLSLTAKISTLPCHGGEAFLRRLFEPLGYAVAVQRLALDTRFPEWGESFYYSVSLTAVVRLRDLLAHLYVLIPVMDDEKHYWVGTDEVEKLLRHGEAWLSEHPEREAITYRYLRRQGRLTRDALSRLVDATAEPLATEIAESASEEIAEAPLRLNDQRLSAVLSALKEAGAKRILDLGCSTGNLLRKLLDDHNFTEIVGFDVSHRSLEIAAERLHFDRLPELQRQRITLLHGSLTYRDRRLSGFDAAAVVEVLEHFDPAGQIAFERVLFEFARPKTIVLTTPNVEFNVHFLGLEPGKLRHPDHRFEWTRAEFQAWGNRMADRFQYTAQFRPVGLDDPTTGPATQMAVFLRKSSS